jgi:hypothetical protein
MTGWQTYSGNGGCVEFQQSITGSVLVRDTKDRNGPFLQFTEAEWSDFTDGIKADLLRKNTNQGVHLANLEGLLVKLDRRLQDIAVLVDESPCRTEADLRFMRTRLRALLGVGA